MPMRRFLILVCVGMLGLRAAWAAGPNGSAVEFHIEAQPVRAALQQFGEQTGMQVLMRLSGEAGDDIKASPVSGAFTVTAALERLLADTGLRYEFVNERTVRVSSAVLATGGAGIANGEPNEVQLAQTGTSSSSVQEERTESERKQAADAAASENGRSGIQEIIVTATKRTQRIQDVPMSISAITAEDIDRKGLVSGEDYLRGMPGVNQAGAGGSYGGNLIVIRGMQTSLRPEGANGTTGTYFGEASTVGSAGFYGSSVDIKLVDIERVEVLRGPQGTAFGSSSLGGAVRVIPAAPKFDRYEGKLAAGYSVTSGSGDRNSMYQAVGNLPLVEGKLAIRAVAYDFSDSGYYVNRAGSNAAYLAGYAVPLGAQTLATDENDVGAYRATGGRISALFQASENLRFTLSYLTQENRLNGVAIQTTGSFEQAMLRVAPEHVRRGQAGGYHDNKIDIANALLEYDFGWADLLATYSYVKGENEFAASGEIFALPWAASYEVPSSQVKKSGEVRIVTKFDGPWNVLAGVYTETTDSESAVNILWTGSSAANPFGQRSLIDNSQRGDLQQNAAFGEISWEIIPRVTLTGGARAFEYQRIDRTDQIGAPLVAGPAISGRRLESEESSAIYRANLSYKPTDDALLYASWSQGFRLGNTGIPAPSGLCDQNGDGILDGTSARLDSVGNTSSDTVDNYEIGGKLALFNRRLAIDIAVFHMDWSDIPVNVRLPAPCTFSYVGNAGGARSEGAELQVSFQALESVRLDLGGSYVDARLTTAVPAISVPAGRPLSGTPEVNANLGAQHDFQLAGHAAYVRLDSIYVGQFEANITVPPNTSAGDYVKLDASARLVTGNLSFDLFVHNLTDEDNFTFRDAVNRGTLYGYRMRPRTVGMQFSYNF